MGAPAPAKKRGKGKAPKGPTIAVIDGEEITEEDIARLEAEGEAAVKAAGHVTDDGEIIPIEIGRAGKVGPEMAHLFTLNGEKFYIPKTPSVPIMLRFMREVRDKKGVREAAVENAMLSMLGKQKLDALSESDEVSDDDFANVMIVVGHILFTAIKKWRARVNPALDPS
jgi:hypothetical protein